MKIDRASVRGTDWSLWIFFGLAYALSWAFWIPAALLHSESLFPLVLMLYAIGGFGPTVAGILFIGRTLDKPAQADFVRRLTSFKRIGALWYVLIGLIFPLFAALTVGVYWVVHTSLPFIPTLEEIMAHPGLLWGLPFIALQALLLGPLSEEIGWRGFALDRLQQRWSALPSSLVLGALWSLWHVPLFFIQGSMYADWGFGGGLFWLFMLRMPALAVIMTWVYNHNRNSILSAILLHFAFNFTFGFFHPAPGELHLYLTLLLAVFAAVISYPWPVRSRGSRSPDGAGSAD